MIKVFKETIDFIRELYGIPDGIIPLHAPVFEGNERKYLQECIDSTFVSSVGKFVDRFENKIVEFTGAKKAVVCVNGTNALFLALKMLGVERDSEVITQPLTFVATANAISYTGAKPVFLDVDFDTMGLSPESLICFLEKNVQFDKRTRISINKLTNKPISACVPVHTFGHPCRIDEIVGICKNYNIPVVEDAAESLGSFYKEQHTGTFGNIGVLSFNGNKIITTGGGGMLLFNDPILAEKAKHLTTQAKLHHPWEFNHDQVGYNYRMPNINAALGLAQLEQINTFVSSKRRIAEKYKTFFIDKDVSFVSEPRNSISNYWLNSILLNNIIERNEFLKYTNENGIMCRPAWTLMNELPMFSECQTDKLENARNISERLVNMPSSAKVDIC